MELKAKALPLNGVLCIGDQGLCLWLWCLVKHCIYFYISCNYAINKIPQLAMGLHRERDGGMILQGIGRGVSQTP